MSLEEIEKEIRKQGEQEITEIYAEAKKIADEIKKEMIAAANSAYQQTKLKRSKEYGIEIKKVVSDARLLKKEKLNRKKVELLGEVFDKAKTRILSMNENEKRKLLENLTADKKEFPDSIVLIDKKYVSLLKDAKPYGLGDFGIVIKSKDGSMKIDRTLSNLMTQLRIKIESEIAKILFK